MHVVVGLGVRRVPRVAERHGVRHGRREGRLAPEGGRGARRRVGVRRRGVSPPGGQHRRLRRGGHGVRAGLELRWDARMGPPGLVVAVHDCALHRGRLRQGLGGVGRAQGRTGRLRAQLGLDIDAWVFC